jgi:glyceraldehyde-3-phosphate dehydrogenase type I
MTKVAINGFGRIGRPVFRRILENHPDLKVVAINDLTDEKTLAHLLKYDSLYGVYPREVGFGNDFLRVGSEKVPVFAQKDPETLPWGKLGVDIVLECTGYFTEIDGAKKHLKAGAKKVIISAPSKSPEVPVLVLGVNEGQYQPEKQQIISMGSCTTNCLAPIAKILNDSLGIISGFMTTVHSYTNDQRILDLPHEDLRRARAAALNIIPTTTGAASAIGRVLPELEGKLDGIALRVPTATVSILDLICQVKKKTSKEAVNDLFEQASKQKGLERILSVEKNPLVSSDFKGNPFSAVVDASLTMAKDDLVKVTAWYDNEYGYACRLAEMTEYVAKQL